MWDIFSILHGSLKGHLVEKYSLRMDENSKNGSMSSQTNILLKKGPAYTLSTLESIHIPKQEYVCVPYRPYLSENCLNDCKSIHSVKEDCSQTFQNLNSTHGWNMDFGSNQTFDKSLLPVLKEIPPQENNKKTIKGSSVWMNMEVSSYES